MTGTTKELIRKKAPALMMAFGVSAVRNLMAQDERTAHDPHVSMAVSRLGSILPYYSMVGDLKPEEAAQITMPEGQLYLTQTIGALLAVGRRDIAYDQLDAFAKALAEHDMPGHAVAMTDATIGFIEGELAGLFRTTSFIPKDFGQTACRSMVAHLRNPIGIIGPAEQPAHPAAVGALRIMMA